MNPCLHDQLLPVDDAEEMDKEPESAETTLKESWQQGRARHSVRAVVMNPYAQVGHLGGQRTAHPTST